MPAVEFEDPARRVVQEVPVVGDCYYGPPGTGPGAAPATARSRRLGGWSARPAAAGPAGTAAFGTARPGAAPRPTARSPQSLAAGSAARPSPARPGHRCPTPGGGPAALAGGPSHRAGHRSNRRPASRPPRCSVLVPPGFRRRRPRRCRAPSRSCPGPAPAPRYSGCNPVRTPPRRWKAAPARPSASAAWTCPSRSAPPRRSSRPAGTRASRHRAPLCRRHLQAETRRPSCAAPH